MNLNQLIKDIQKGKNTDKNLVDYASALASSYAYHGLYMMAMDLTAGYDLIREDTSVDSEVMAGLLDELTEVIRTAVISDDLTVMSEEDRRALFLQAKKAGDIRQRICRRMDALEDYAYFLQFYEYRMNRLDTSAIETYKDTDIEAFANDLLAAIFSESDMEEVNERLKSVMEELPVRLTTAKFFDMIRQSFGGYKGVRCDIADAFAKSVERNARIVNLSDLDQGYAQLYAQCEKMETLELEKLNAEEFKNIENELQTVAFDLAAMLHNYLQLAGIANEVWMYLLTRPYATGFNPYIKKAMTVVTEFLREEEKGSFLTPDEDIVGLLRELTDHQELMEGEHMLLEDALFDIINRYSESIESIGCEAAFKNFQICALLTMTAMFREVELYDHFALADDAYLDALSSKVETGIRDVFDRVDRQKKRMMMSMILGTLPVVFNRIEDMRAYVVNSLESCRDLAERTTCISLLSQMFLNQ